MEAFERVAYGNTSNTSGQHITRRDDGYEVLGANDHPTVKPIALMRYLCRLVTPRGGLIVDPYAGSGTTGCAAALEGFQFQGFELGERNCAIAMARIAAMQPGLSL